MAAPSSSVVAQSRRAAVIGSGLVGRCWVILFARAGFDVNLFDSFPDAVAKALPFISSTSEELLKNGLLGAATSVEQVMNRVKVTDNLKDALTDVEWIQECVPENIEQKKAVYLQMCEALATLSSTSSTTSKAIFGSSTSAIPCSAFTSDLPADIRERCLVAHPVNPPHLIPLVEIVPAPYTRPEVVQRARAILEEIGQKPILVKKEVDSFVLNRLQGALLNEAFRLVEDGVIDVADLDRTIKDGLGLRWCFMGPFETIDLNAPGGVKDYIQRYGDTMYQLARQQADPRKWQGQVVDTVTEQRRSQLSVDKLPERSKWRDNTLIRVVALKKELEKADKQQS